jgi:hypothetical protein
MPRRCFRGLQVLVLGGVLSPIASASDGVLEINQACATAPGGCFPGDSAGFPVTLGASGSYRLTSELSASGDASGIEILAPDVTLDLGGFTVRGARPCTGTFPQLSCTAGVGRGIAGTAPNAQVASGMVTGFAGGGLELGAGALVSNIVAHHDGGNGITVGERGRVTDSQATLNGGIGISVGSASLIHRCSSVSNLDRALSPGATALDSVTADGPGSAGTCFADAFEPNQTEGTTASLGSVSDADANGASFAAELDGSGDADWFSYQLNDGPGATPDPALTLTSGGPLRMCLFYQCESGTLALTCPAGSTAATSPSGRGGCCITGSSLQIVPDCTGGFGNSGTVAFRLDSGPAGQCTAYSLSWHP